MQRDALTDAYNAEKRKNSNRSNEMSVTNETKEKAKQKSDTILESVDAIRTNHPIVTTLHQTKAEITVVQRVLDVEMIKMSLKMIKNEHASLLAAFE
jgi:hypothetical protein